MFSFKYKRETDDSKLKLKINDKRVIMFGVTLYFIIKFLGVVGKIR